MHNFTLLLARLALTLVFIVTGVGKLTAYAAASKLLVAHGLPAGLLPLMIVIELGGGVAILAGLYTRAAAWLLFVYTLAVGMAFHTDLANPQQLLDFMRSLAIAGGFLALAVQGAGRLSLDAWRRRHRQRQKLFS
ncbi:MAG TPA: DoxX family protein [Rhodanobacteraceae bacterium]|nr:DoxX family protein [Rhodanobacteraceae bacterium]